MLEPVYIHPTACSRPGRGICYMQEHVAILVEVAIACCSAEYRGAPKVEVVEGLLRLMGAVQWRPATLLAHQALTAPLLACVRAAQQGRLPDTSFSAGDVSSRIAVPVLHAYGAGQLAGWVGQWCSICSPSGLSRSGSVPRSHKHHDVERWVGFLSTGLACLGLTGGCLVSTPCARAVSASLIMGVGVTSDRQRFVLPSCPDHLICPPNLVVLLRSCSERRIWQPDPPAASLI
jgi:hypothetical protein